MILQREPVLDAADVVAKVEFSRGRIAGKDAVFLQARGSGLILHAGSLAGCDGEENGIANSEYTCVMEFTHAQQRLILNVARSTIYRFLSSGADNADPSIIAAASAEAALCSPAGCFVTLHELGTHQLRGCIGRLDAGAPLLTALQTMASNVLDDPRFSYCPVHLGELRSLQIEVSVLSPLRTASNPMAFDPRTDGLLLTIGQCSGCFLPQVARETGWGREMLLDRLCTEKMHLPASAWRDPGAELSLFSAVTVGPEPFVPPDSTS